MKTLKKFLYFWIIQPIYVALHRYPVQSFFFTSRNYGMVTFLDGKIQQMYWSVGKLIEYIHPKGRMVDYIVSLYKPSEITDSTIIFKIVIGSSVTDIQYKAHYKGEKHNVTFCRTMLIKQFGVVPGKFYASLISVIK